MSHVVHPYSIRLVIQRDWKSRWFASGKNYRDNLRADILMREFLAKELRDKYVSSIEFERGQKSTRLVLRSSRPGMIIGRSGEGAQKLKKSVLRFMRKNDIQIPEDFKIDIVEVPNPDADASIVAQNIREQLEKRMPFRRVMKMTLEKLMATKGVKGARIVLKGLLGGSATMARREEVRRGGIPLQFLRGDVDYAHKYANSISIKVWVYKGESFERVDNLAAAKDKPQKKRKR